MSETYRLRLYVSGRTPRSQAAIRHLYEICEKDLAGRYELEIVDVLEQPQIAEDDKVLATPMLVRRLPPPIRRLVGDLSEREGVLLGLDLQAKPGTDTTSPEGH